jgi:hypothetical protein
VLHFKKFTQKGIDSGAAFSAWKTPLNQNETLTPALAALGLEATNDTGKRLQRS